jgi:hypothetical protein
MYKKCTCADSFYKFFCLVDENIKLTLLACSSEITNFENLSSNLLFKDHKAAIVTLKMFRGSRLR